MAVFPIDEDKHRQEQLLVAKRQGEEIYRNSRSLALTSIRLMSVLEDALDLAERLKPSVGFRDRPETEDSKPDRKGLFTPLAQHFAALNTETLASDHWRNTGNLLGPVAGHWLEQNDRLDYVIEQLTSAQHVLANGMKTGESAVRILERIQDLERAIDQDGKHPAFQHRQQIQNRIASITQGVQETLDFISANRPKWRT